MKNRVVVSTWPVFKPDWSTTRMSVRVRVRGTKTASRATLATRLVAPVVIPSASAQVGDNAAPTGPAESQTQTENPQLGRERLRASRRRLRGQSITTRSLAQNRQSSRAISERKTTTERTLRRHARVNETKCAGEISPNWQNILSRTNNNTRTTQHTAKAGRRTRASHAHSAARCLARVPRARRDPGSVTSRHVTSQQQQQPAVAARWPETDHWVTTLSIVEHSNSGKKKFRFDSPIW